MSVETSIVIRTLNESKHLEKLLQGIHGQNYRDWEIILVDSGSTDGTVDIAQRYGVRIYHIPKDEFTFGRSLNLGCRQAQGRYLVFASGHVWPITNNWLRNMVQPFRDPSVAMVYGRQLGTEATRLSELRDLDTQFGPTSNILIDEAKGNNGNAAIRRELWLDQPFDESLPGLEDVDWARKAEKLEFRVYYAADAAVYHVHEESLKQIYNRYLREATAAKRMFPNYRFSGTDMGKALPYFMVRDVLYALRHRKMAKIFQVPGSRAAQFMGMYRGVRYQKQLSREVIHHLESPTTRQRVVVNGPGRHALEPSEIPELRPDGVLVQVAYTAVSSGDSAMANGQQNQRQEGSPSYPMFPGHDFSGIVVSRGAKAGSLKKGQKVVGTLAGALDGCLLCAFANHHQSPGEEWPGGPMTQGAYADYLAVPSNKVLRLPADMPLKHAVLVEPVALCLDGIDKLGIGPGSRACVSGAGPIGNLCAQILRARGICVVAVDRNPRWLRLLYKYDVDTLTEFGEPGGYDYLIDTTGSREMLPYLKDNSGPSVKVLLLGRSDDDSLLSYLNTESSHNNVFHSCLANRRDTWREAIGLVHRGVVRLEDHTASVEPLEAYRRAWSSLEDEKQFKVLLRVSEELEAL